MEDELIGQIISSDELIMKNIEENNRMMSESFQDQFSSIMSMTSANSSNIEKQLDVQGQKEAELIKGNLTQNLSQFSNLNLQDIAETKLAQESGVISENTLNSLIKVISDLQGVIDNLNLNQPTTTQQTLPISQNEIGAVNVENISMLIDDFKTLSSLTWCADWLKCLEKIIEQADNVNKALSSIPDNKKIEFGVTNESLDNVQQSIQKVKEEISSEINLSAVKEELVQQNLPNETQISPAFLNSFSDFNDKISNVVEKIDKSTISTESFVSKISEFSENTITTIDNSFNEISKTNQALIEKPVGVENTFQSLQTTIKEIETGIIEKKSEPFSLKIVESSINIPTTESAFGEMPMTMPPLVAQTPLATQTPTAEVNVQGAVPPPLLAFGEMPMTMPPLVAQTPLATQTPTAQVNVQGAVPPPPQLAFGEMLIAMPPLFAQTPTAQVNVQGAVPNTLQTLSNIPNESIMELKSTSLPFNLETFTSPKLFNESNIFPTSVNNISSQLNVGSTFENIPFLENISPNNLGENIQISTQRENQFNPLSFESLMVSNNTASENIPQTTISNLLNNKGLEIGSFESLFGNTIKNNEIAPTQVGTEAIASPTIPNIEEILVKSQEISTPNLATAVSKLETQTPEKTSDILANSQVMMSEINFEPLNKTFSSSISNLQETLKSQKTEVSTNTPDETLGASQNETMTKILSMLTKLDETLIKISENPQQARGVMPSMGSSISDNQARIIGRQIASELKDNFSKLYN